MKKLFLALCLLTTANAIGQYKFTGYDILPGAGNSSNPANFITVNGRLYFTAYTTGSGTELFTIDPPFNQASILKDINPGSIGSNPGDFFEYNGKLLFTADDGNTGKELWITDGTASGTQMIQDILLGTIGSTPRGFCLCGGKVYFAATTLSEGEELWVTDGTSAGTYLVKDIRMGNNGSSIGSLYNFNDSLFFSADDGTNIGKELWKSDGTSAGTLFVKDIANGVLDGNPKMFITLNGKLYFIANTQFQGEEWWTTNGTSAGTTMVVDLGPGMPAGVLSMNSFAVVFNNAIYFNGGTVPSISIPTGTGNELYKTDGTSAGTVLVKEMTPGAGGTALTWPLISGNKLYFVAEVAANGKELWVTDGTTAGTNMVSDIISGTTGSDPSHPILFKNKIFFAANTATSDRQLYVTDGTGTGTAMLKPSGGLADALNAGVFNGCAVLDSMMFFAANYDSKNAEMWMVKDTASTSVSIVNTDNRVAVYPNPNSGSFVLEIAKEFKSGNVSVYDVIGREVYQSQILNPKLQITLSNQPKGIYMVKVQLDETILTRRITVE